MRELIIGKSQTEYKGIILIRKILEIYIMLLEYGLMQGPSYLVFGFLDSILFIHFERRRKSIPVFSTLRFLTIGPLPSWASGSSIFAVTTPNPRYPHKLKYILHYSNVLSIYNISAPYNYVRTPSTYSHTHSTLVISRNNLLCTNLAMF